MGFKMNRQFVIHHSTLLNKDAYFIADFYCHEKKLVIEIDGAIHNEQKEYDQIRTDILEHMGYRIARFTNDEVLQNWDEVERRLRRVLSEV